MSATTWTVDVDGVVHTISVEVNPEARRAMIRVDGRPAAKPLSDEETERQIAVGTKQYLLRRIGDDTFDLDIAPATFLNPAHPATAARPRARTQSQPMPPQRSVLGKILKIAGGVIAVLFVIGLLRIGSQGLAYKNVPWQPYRADDGSFKVNLAGEPQESSEERNIGGEIWKVVTLKSKYRNHFYLVDYVDVHRVVTEANQPELLQQFFSAVMGALTAKNIEQEKTTMARNPAIRFVAHLPKGLGEGEEKLNVDARMKGEIVMRDNRIILAYSLAAESDPISWDRDKFIESFEVQPPAPRSQQLITTIDYQDAPRPPATSTQPPTSVTRIYVDAKTKTYWPEDCAGRPERAFPMAKSLAISQGYTLAPSCAK
jgi:hypothetical protein